MNRPNEIARRASAGLTVPWHDLFGQRHDALRASLLKEGAISDSKTRTWYLADEEQLQRVQQILKAEPSRVVTMPREEVVMPTMAVSPPARPATEPEPQVEAAPEVEPAPEVEAVPSTHLTVNRNDIYLIAREAAGVCKRTSGAMPILKNLRMRTAGNVLLVAFTDIDVWCATWLPIGICEPLDCCVDAVGFERAVKPDSAAEKQETVQIHVENGQVVVECGGATVKLYAAPVKDYPVVPWSPPADISGLSWDGAARKALLAALDFTMKSMCLDETRHPLRGLAFAEVHGTPSIAATDGHRLHVAPIAGAAGKLNWHSETSALLPDTLARLWRRLLNVSDGPAMLAWMSCGKPVGRHEQETGTWWLTAGRWSLRGKENQSLPTPPPINQVIPNLGQMNKVKNYTACGVEPDALAKAIKKCMRPLCSRTKGISLVANGALVLESCDFEGVQSKVICKAQDIIVGVHESPAISVDNLYLLESVKDGTAVRLHWLAGGLDPLIAEVTVDGLDCTAVVMPLRR